MKIQLECLNPECGTKVAGNGKTQLDGWACPKCDGPAIVNPFNPSDQHIDYKEAREMLKNRRKKSKSLEIEVKVTKTDLFKRLIQILKDTAEDDRLPADVKQDLEHKIKSLTESMNEAWTRV